VKGIVIPIESVCWRALACSEVPASLCASASCYRFPKDVGILAVVMTELEFRKVQRQIFLADVVVSADHATLEQAPERFDVVGVDLAANILAFAMIDGLMRDFHRSEPSVSAVLISRDQTDPIRNRSANKAVKRASIRIFDHLTDHVPLACYRTDNRGLAGIGRAAPAVLCPILGVTVALFPADVGLIDFNDSHQFLEVRIVHGRTQAMADVPSGMERRSFAKEHPANLTRRNALFALEHRVKNLEPSQKRHLGILENRSSRQREAIGVSAPAFRIRALPFPSLRDVVNRLELPAARASRPAVSPTPKKQEVFAGVLSRKRDHQLLERHHE
jgi:hypothetical protein